MHAVLVRCRLNRLSHIDIRTGEPIRRYEHDRPGSLIHVDVKKLGNIPEGGGWRFVGRTQGNKNRAATSGVTRSRRYHPNLGHAFVHTVIDDHSHVAYAEVHHNELAQTAVAVLRRAVSWFHARGVTIERALSDNGGCYMSHAWRDACADLHIKHKRTRPYRPQTNGKSRDSTAPWPMNGHSAATIPTNSHAGQPCRAGCTPTITTGNTLRSARSHPSPG